MGRCFVFAAGELSLPRLYPREPGDLVIAADAGWRRCIEAGVTPDLLLGDFDSMPPPENFPHMERFPVEKDDTDTMLALKVGLSRGFREFHLYGGTGGDRLDHTFANLQSLLYLRRRGAKGFLYGRDFVWTVMENETLTLPREVENGLLSVFSLTEQSRGVTLTGVQYPLDGAVLTAEFPLGVSNHITGEQAEIQVEAGALLVGWQLPAAP